MASIACHVYSRFSLAFEKARRVCLAAISISLHNSRIYFLVTCPTRSIPRARVHLLDRVIRAGCCDSYSRLFSSAGVAIVYSMCALGCLSSRSFPHRVSRDVDTGIRISLFQALYNVTVPRASSHAQNCPGPCSRSFYISHNTSMLNRGPGHSFCRVSISSMVRDFRNPPLYMCYMYISPVTI